MIIKIVCGVCMWPFAVGICMLTTVYCFFFLLSAMLCDV